MINEIIFYDDKKLDFQLIEETFLEVFGKKIEKKYWEWRFKKNPHDKIYINYILKKDKLAAYYAVSPCLVNINDKKYKIALSNMTMTHPDYRGNGFFKKLASTMYKKLMENDYIGVIGFANTNSHYGFRKYLNWYDIAPLFIVSLQENSIKNYTSTLENIEIKDEKVTISGLHDILKLYCSKTHYLVNRDLKSFEWRVLENPLNEYFIIKVFCNEICIGALIYKEYANATDIMEIFYSEKFNQIDVLYELISKLNYKKVNIWSNLYTDEYLLLEKFGFKPDNFVTYFGIIPFRDDLDLTNNRNWHYRFLDSDVF